MRKIVEKLGDHFSVKIAKRKKNEKFFDFYLQNKNKNEKYILLKWNWIFQSQKYY